MKDATYWDCVDMEMVARISIHAPMKDATGMYIGIDNLGGISIHAPMKDATQ